MAQEKHSRYRGNVYYCSKRPGQVCGVDVFIDSSKSYKPYDDFLRLHNPTRSKATRQIANKTRPDILLHQTKGSIYEWYEIKPASASGVQEALKKLLVLKYGYPALGYPYIPGNKYTPKREISLQKFSAEGGGELLDIYIEVVRPIDGIIVWWFCVRGDVVLYIRRVGMVAAVLAILAALSEIIVAAAAAGTEIAVTAAAVIAELRAIAALVSITIPILQKL